jgi:serine/threonine-protein kinase PRP4
MSRSSTASEGEVIDTRHKANTVNSRNEPAINGSNRSFGLDGAYDDYRALSRSPSPYRAPRRNRTPSRSPSPYRRNRAVDRSPSPYRASRDDRARGDSQAFKRKASPPRGRPDKRHHADRSRHDDPRRASGPPQTAFVRERKEPMDRPYAKPISYAEVEHPNPVPDFRERLSTTDRREYHRDGDQKREKPRQSQAQKQRATSNGVKAQIAQPSVTEDLEMYVPPSNCPFSV